MDAMRILCSHNGTEAHQKLARRITYLKLYAHTTYHTGINMDKAIVFNKTIFSLCCLKKQIWRKCALLMVLLAQVKCYDCFLCTIGVK